MDGPSKPNKLLWPAAGVSKQDLWDYLAAVADRMLPWFTDRPLTLLRHPEGIDGDGFFAKDLPSHAPSEIKRFEQRSDSGRVTSYMVPTRLSDLQWAGHMGTIEFHPGHARVERIDRPDRFIIDIDPGDDPDVVIPACQWVHKTLNALEIESLVKTSGKRGLHVMVQVERRYSFEELRDFGHGIATATAAAHPNELTTRMRKKDRGGRLFLDWSRNGSWQTVVGPYSPRVHPDATVSAPLSWDEVTEDLELTSFTMRTVPDRDDPWADPPEPQRIETARTALTEHGFMPS